MVEFEVPDLDACDELQLHELKNVYRLLGGYCECKLRLEWLRRRGRLDAAANNEKLMRGIFERLPIWARWKGGA